MQRVTPHFSATSHSAGSVSRSIASLVLEPSREGALVTWRKGVGRFELEIQGRASHSGAAHERGVLDCLDAIRAGDVYQACLSTRFHGTVEPAPSTSTTARTSSAPDAATPLPSTVSGTTPNPTVMAAAGWWARRVVKHGPVRAAFLAGIDADGAAVTLAESFSAGLVPLAVLLAWVGIGLFAARRWMRWDTRR